MMVQSFCCLLGIGLGRAARWGSDLSSFFAFYLDSDSERVSVDC
jgi:hypothetical protein